MSKIIDGITKDLKELPKKLAKKSGNVNAKQLIIKFLPYVLAGYFCDKIAYLYRTADGEAAADKLMGAMTGMDTMFQNPLPSFHPQDLLIGALCGAALRLVVYFKAKNAKKFRQGEEYGSARWAA